MTLPADAYIYEFLYRGQPADAAQLPAYHVIVGVPGTDLLGNSTLALSSAMTPDQAAAQGFDLPTLLNGINVATIAQVTTLQTLVANLQPQLSEAQSQAASLQAQIAVMQGKQPAPTGTNLTFLQFQALFTSAEETAIMTAAQSTPALMLWLLKAAGAQFIDLSDPQTKAGLDELVAVGVLTADRETAILAGTPPS